MYDKIVKLSLNKSRDAYQALRNYKATPLANRFSPSKLLMRRRLKTGLPVSTKKLTLKILDLDELRNKGVNKQK